MFRKVTDAMAHHFKVAGSTDFYEDPGSNLHFSSNIARITVGNPSSASDFPRKQ